MWRCQSNCTVILIPWRKFDVASTGHVANKDRHVGLSLSVSRGFTVEEKGGPHPGEGFTVGLLAAASGKGGDRDGPVVWSEFWMDVNVVVVVVMGLSPLFFFYPFLLRFYFIPTEGKEGFCRLWQQREGRKRENLRRGEKFLEEIYSRFHRQAVLRSCIIPVEIREL
ncbi:hypothetical protein SAY86_007059 [Trapa natans]|uniref:Uncharacterized protein n=1 Tax=Trapa natans TaxID=22666 RepID=A0AAN7LCV9_TRANT|nr:hypothetical protein SAY86_007059 [Trapa natans]